MRETTLSFLDEMEKIAADLDGGPYADRGRCPECGEVAVEACRCRIGDAKCCNGHTWHKENGKIVSGSGHGRVSPSKMAAVLLKEAGFMRDVGTRIVRSASKIPRNVEGSAGALLSPVQGFKRGLKWTATDWNKGSRLNKAMLVGGTVMGARDASKKTDDTGQNRSRLARISQFAGSTAGGIVGAPFGVTGGLVGGLAGDAAGRAVGKTVDAVTGYKKRHPARPTSQETPLATQPQRFDNIP